MATTFDNVKISFTEQGTAPATPPSGEFYIYVKTDGKIYGKNDAGTEGELGGGSSPLTTKGDLYTYSSADARLAVGTNGQKLVAASGETTGLKWYTPASDTDQPDVATDYNSTSATFVAISATDLSVSVTPSTTKVLIDFYGSFFNSGTLGIWNLNLYVDIDGGGYNALAIEDGLTATLNTATTQIITQGFRFLHTGLTPGSVYTYRPYWQTAAGTINMLAGANAAALQHPQFYAIEVG